VHLRRVSMASARSSPAIPDLISGNERETSISRAISGGGGMYISPGNEWSLDH